MQVLFGSRFLKKVVSQGPAFSEVYTWHQKSQQRTKKLCNKMSNFISSEIEFMWTNGFYRYERLYTCRRQECQNIPEKRLFSCFELLLHVVNVVNADVTLEVCIH